MGMPLDCVLRNYSGLAIYCAQKPVASSIFFLKKKAPRTTAPKRLQQLGNRH